MLKQLHNIKYHILLVIILGVFLLVGCRATAPETKDEVPAPAVTISGLKPATPQPAGEQLRPGLSVLYFDNFLERHIDKLPTGDKALKKGKPGKPVLYLGHKFGSMHVFDSGSNRGVGMQMTGLLRFDRVGEYVFKVNSNDGFRMFINGRMVLDDPTVHSDRFSDPATIQIDAVGWYPLMAQYFQRKGTATLELYWQPPEAGDFSLVPPKVFAHMTK
ncbi:PA14 domain-containing protein [Thermodesulfobacteriota bacterium]